MKPASFFDLPAKLQESFLWDMDLDYNSYESSKVECIHGIMCGNVWSRNPEIINDYYERLSEKEIHERAKSVRENLLGNLISLENFIDNP